MARILGKVDLTLHGVKSWQKKDDARALSQPVRFASVVKRQKTTSGHGRQAKKAAKAARRHADAERAQKIFELSK